MDVRRLWLSGVTFVDGGTTWTTTVADVTGPRTFAPARATVGLGAPALLK